MNNGAKRPFSLWERDQKPSSGKRSRELLHFVRRQIVYEADGCNDVGLMERAMVDSHVCTYELHSITQPLRFGNALCYFDGRPSNVHANESLRAIRQQSRQKCASAASAVHNRLFLQTVLD